MGPGSRGITSSALVGALALGATAVALAVTPDLGAYDWRGSDGAVRFLVASAEPRLDEVAATAVRCGPNGKSIEVPKSVEVSASGRFAYDGKAAVVGGGRTQVDLRGRFEKPTKAEGRIEIGGCDGKLRFAARRIDGP